MPLATQATLEKNAKEPGMASENVTVVKEVERFGGKNNESLYRTRNRV